MLHAYCIILHSHTQVRLFFWLLNVNISLEWVCTTGTLELITKNRSYSGAHHINTKWTLSTAVWLLSSIAGWENLLFCNVQGPVLKRGFTANVHIYT